MLSAKMEKALNQQIVEENFSAHFYLAMASWCEKTGLRGSAKFFYHHADEEHQHMMKFVKYINETGAHALIGGVKEPAKQFKALGGVVEIALKHEQHITRCIGALAELAMDEKDYSTFQFLQWFVSEQHEEEALFRTVTDIIRVGGVEGHGLYFVDKEIGKLVGKS
ncbi:MAG: ferritin [Candidatus Omnitrophota bacterium]|jgi:ferritin